MERLWLPIGLQSEVYQSRFEVGSTRQLNIGVDAAFLNGRLVLLSIIFDKKTN